MKYTYILILNYLLVKLRIIFLKFKEFNLKFFFKRIKANIDTLFVVVDTWMISLSILVILVKKKIIIIIFVRT